MAVARSFSLGRFLKRYSVVIIFPVFTATTIFADYSRTKNWKAQKALQQKLTKNEDAL